MKAIRVFLLAVTLGAAAAPFARAHYGYRQYYDSTWPTVRRTTITTLRTTIARGHPNDVRLPLLHLLPYAVAYIYYYNPVSQVYWGRYEIGSKGDKRYSILADKDRKKDLKEIPEKAFPKPARCPLSPAPRTASPWSLRQNVPKDKK